MVINLVQGFRTKILPTHKANIGLIYPDAKYLVIRIPDSRVLLFLARSAILALLIVSIPWLNSLVPITSTANEFFGSSGDPNLDLMPVVFHDLAKEGLIKTGHGEKAVFVSNGATQSSEILKDNGVDLIHEEQQNSVIDQSVDFAFISAIPSAMKFIERTLKVGGIVALQLSEEPSARFRIPSNYKMVYLRKFDTTVMAMKKMSSSSSVPTATSSSATRRRLLSEDAKKEALKNLEDVLLEPPRAKSGKSSRYLKKTRYLPDLMGDSLEGYSRRVFIDVGGSGTSWFAKNYPTRNKNFEMYKIETTLTDESGSKGIVQTSMSGWLEKNVKEEEYVVMKAEAEVVEEMMQGKVMNLVDELFLECKPQGHNGKGNNVSTRRAYWQCLALYGQLRDEGVAVHQWWG